MLILLGAQLLGLELSGWVVFTLYNQSHWGDGARWRFQKRVGHTAVTHSHPGAFCGLQNPVSAGKTWHQTRLLSSDLLSCELSLYPVLAHNSHSKFKMLSQSLLTDGLGWGSTDL